MKLGIFIGVLIRWTINITLGYYIFQENSGLATRIFIVHMLLLNEIEAFTKVTIPMWKRKTL